MRSVEEMACSTKQLQQLAQAEMDWTEFKAAVAKFDLPMIEPSSTLDADRRAATATACQHSIHQPFMARTVSSKAHSVAAAARRQSSDAHLPVSTLYERRQRAQIWAQPAPVAGSAEEGNRNRQPCSLVQPYMRAHTGGLAHTYGSRSRDQPKGTAALINAMREASTSSKPPKATSRLVAHSRQRPATRAAVGSGCTVRQQGLADEATQQYRQRSVAFSRQSMSSDM